MAQAAAQTESFARYEMAGPALLAMTPNEPRNPKKESLEKRREWEVMYGHLQARMTMLINWRNSWLAHWAALGVNILPRRNMWLAEQSGTWPVPNNMSRGREINKEIIDPTGTYAMRICAAGLLSGLMSPTRPWFKLKAGIENYEPEIDAQMWFEETEHRIYSIMAHSNFYDSGAQMFEDITVFGTAPVIIYEDVKEIIRCYNPVAGEYVLASSSSFRPESFGRLFTLTASQIIEQFGLENCPEDVRKLWASKGSNLEVEKIVAHMIEPNFPVADRGGTGKDIRMVPSSFPWREIYWIWGNPDGKPLSTRGFLEQPHVAPRWATTSNDAYGRSAGMDALPDVMQLQLETKRKAEAIEKQVRPPLLADVSLKNEPSSILPGHVTYVAALDASKGMRPIYEVQPDLQNMTLDLQEIQKRIQKGFFNDLFLMLADSPKEMTAFEVAQRQQEKLQVLGPVIERFQNEFASPAISRIFAIMQRKKILPPLPQSLKGVPIQIEYVGLLALAQRATATAGLEALEAMVGRIVAVDPTVMDAVDNIELVREYADLQNVSKKVLRTPQQVKQIQQQKQQAQQQANMMRGALTAGSALAQGAQTLSQTPVGQGSTALNEILGLGGNGQQPANAA